MKQSILFAPISKQDSSDETSVSAKLLIRAGFVDKVMAGVYSYLPLGLRVLNKIENIIREEMDGVGGQELVMPVLHPKENWEKTGRWVKFDALYKLKGRDGKEMALGPTHEEIIVPLAKKFVNSYKDLPFYLYQIQTKFRDELRPKSGLLRGREFLMKDLYSFHADENDLDRFYEIIKKTYMRIFKRLGLNVLVVEASGGTFSKYSYEFQILSDAGEDTIFYCDGSTSSLRGCKWAQNREIAKLKAGDNCPKCGNKIKSGKGIEVGNIFKLGTGYSEPFGLKYKDKKGKEKKVFIGCYGIGLGRLMATIVEVNHDDRGIIWPENVCPFRVHLLTLDSQNKNIRKTADKLYQDCQKSNIDVLYDERQGVSAGEKFAESDLIGIPLRAIISEKTLAKNSVEIKNRDKKEVKLIKIDKLTKYFGNL